MGSTEHIERATELRTWPGDFPVSHLFTAGLAGERFLAEIRDNSRFLGARCAACDHVYVPPSIFCPQCLAALDEWVEVGPQGTVRAVTVAHLGPDERPLDAPEVIALIQLDGANGLLAHRIGEADGVRIGDRVEPVLADERVGSILDVRYFRPA